MTDAASSTMSRLAPSFLPSTAVLELTYRCNHTCLFCSCPWEAPNSKFIQHPELSTGQWKDVIAHLAEMGACTLALTGGEALLKEGFWEIVEYAASCTAEKIETVDGELQSRRQPLDIHLISNGSAVNREVLELCKRFDVQLSMSLPGLATYREHTQHGDPDHVLQQFRDASSLGIKTVVNVTVTRKNLGELYETLAAAFLAGAQQLLLNRFLPGGRGLQYAEELLLDPSQVRQMLDTAEEALCDAGRYGSVGTELPRCVIDPTRYERLRVGTRCSAVISFFVIDPSGYARACNHSAERITHIGEIETMKTHPYWKRFTQMDYLPSACVRCELAKDCDGGCREAAHVFYGQLDAPDPLMKALGSTEAEAAN